MNRFAGRQLDRISRTARGKQISGATDLFHVAGSGRVAGSSGVGSYLMAVSRRRDMLKPGRAMPGPMGMRVRVDRDQIRRLWDALVFDSGEVLVLVPMHLERGEKFGVVVAHRKPVARPLVAGFDTLVVVVVGGGGARHPGGSIIVGRDRKRPVAELGVIAAQQLGRGLGLAHRVEPIVVVARNLHIMAAGRARKLPNPDRART